MGTASEGAARTPLCARSEVEDAHDQWDPLVSERETREVRLRRAILIVQVFVFAKNGNLTWSTDSQRTTSRNVTSLLINQS